MNTRRNVRVRIVVPPTPGHTHPHFYPGPPAYLVTPYQAPPPGYRQPYVIQPGTHSAYPTTHATPEQPYVIQSGTHSAYPTAHATPEQPYVLEPGTHSAYPTAHATHELPPPYQATPPECQQQPEHVENNLIPPKH